jgi:hypothetical protein
MHRSLARYSAPVSFVQAPSWADFITTMVGFEVFGTHRNNQTDFDYAIRRFDPPAPARTQGAAFFTEAALFSAKFMVHLEISGCPRWAMPKMSPSTAITKRCPGAQAL